MRQVAFWLRWSGRDLRGRWVQVAAIALIIALGSGFYSGLSSTSTWRRRSYDASYERSRMYDLRLTLSTGSSMPADQLRSIMSGIPSADQVVGSAVRLVAPVQVDASTADRTIIVPGTVVGIDLSSATGDVSTLSVIAGRGLTPADAGRGVVVLDPHVAQFYDLPPSGQLTLSGGRTIDYVGTGLTPEYFVVMGREGHEASAADFAVLFTSLETAQSLVDQPGQANDLAVRLDPGADADQVRGEIDQAMATAAPTTGYTWTAGVDDPARQQLYHGVESTQKLYTIFAALLLAGAAFGAFNLTVRIVESQRREMGVAMALGTPRRRIAIRPLLLGLEVAVLGALLGVGVGLLVNAMFATVIRRYLPLPVWDLSFQLDGFLRGAALGIILPFVAVAIPVWGAVRMQPVDAIRTSAASASGMGLAPWLARLRLPGNSMAQLPIRNVLRSPRRSALTALGIAATITVLVALLGIVDSLHATIDSSREVFATDTDRAIITLDRFHLIDEPDVQAIVQSPVVDRSTTDIAVVGTASNDGHSIDLVINLVDTGNGVWTPPISAGSPVDPAGGPGLVLTEQAASELHVRVGDSVTLHHPRREGATAYQFVDSEVPVVGLTPAPLRFLAYLDRRAADLMQLQGTTNLMTATPAAGVSHDQFIRTLYALPGVGSVQTPSATVAAVSQQLDEILGILRIVDGALVLLAALIAFNSTSINLDERAREQATMFAFGLRLRTVLAIAVTESVITGLVGTVLGILAGRVVLTWIITQMLPEVVPDIGVLDHLAGRTVWVALALGVLAVSLAPMLSYRRLDRMDVPSTLRVME